MKNVLLRCLLAGSLLGTLHLSGANWPNWRGPFHNGSTSESGLPEKFSKTEGVKWAIELPGRAASTPIIWGDLVFLTATDESTKTLLVYALRRADGGTVWKHEVGSGISRDERSNYASPSPVTDGQLVYFFFGNGELLAFDFSGKKIWSRNIQKDYGDFAFQWTFSASPVLHEGRLYLQVLQRNQPVNGRGRTDGPNDSYLLAMDPATGKELWRHIRPAEARSESLEAFSTPVPFEFNGRKELLIAGGDCLTGHDPATGRELWRWGTWNPNRITHWRLVPSPLGAGSVVLACAPKGSPVYAVKAGRSGTLSDADLAWVSTEREISSDVSTPLYYQGSVYLLNSDRKTLSRLEPGSGKVVWTGELSSRSKFEASPLGADGRIYLMNHEGQVHVVQAGGERFVLLHQVDMGGEGDRELRASVIAAQGQLFIRTGRTLYCLRK